MNVLVVGGAASGKSAYAERYACSLSVQRTYAATMRPTGKEARLRIARHRRQRGGLGFITVECGDGSLAPLLFWAPPTAGVVLVEDVGNLVANALFAGDDGTMAEPAKTLERLECELRATAAAYDHLVVVGNEVGCEGRSYFDGTRAWVHAMGSLNCRLAAWCDMVVEVCAGVPIVVKGVLR